MEQQSSTMVTTLNAALTTISLTTQIEKGLLMKILSIRVVDLFIF
jgi:hypothetical protein